jgi:hypothetical protein
VGGVRGWKLMGVAVAMAALVAPVARATEANPGDPPLVHVDVRPRPGSVLPVTVDLNVWGACDGLDTADCLLPFPNDRFTVADPTTATGRRVHLDLGSMPRNVAGLPIDPTEWNRNDGFSPSTPILTFVPGLDLAATWGTEVPSIADPGRYAAPDAPMVLLDAATGQRVPFWSERDQHEGTADSARLLIVHPTQQLLEGHRYVVALRRLRSDDGSLISATPLFRAYRDRTPVPTGAPYGSEARRPHLEQLFRQLTAAGIQRDELFLAWDFTVASERNLTERVLKIRDEAFASLGDRDLGNSQIEGRAPRFTVTHVQDLPTGATLRRVEGTVTVPNYLTPQAEVTTDLPPPVGNVGQTVNDAIGTLPSSATGPVKSALPINPLDLLTHPLSVPGSRFWTVGSTDGLPVVDPLQPTVDVPFECDLARSSTTHPSHPTLYGHGLLGSRGEVSGGSTERLRERGFSPCAVDWWGMSFSDLPNVATVLADIGRFPSVADRSQQGFLNFMFLGRALSHPDGFASNPAFQDGHGRALIATGELFYDGNSQGSILGGALTALEPDLRRSVLGVAGMGFSTLLNRSVDWEDRYAAVYQAAYPSEVGRQLGFALLQMLWDRGETAGYAQQMTDRPLPHTPTHDVMLQIAFGDHQVANVTAEVEARTIGAKLKWPPLAPHQHWAVDPAFGFTTVAGDRAEVGSVLVYWYAAGIGDATPPDANRPDRAGKDPHEVPRRYGPATDQVARFLLTDDLIDVCGGGPCVVPPTS